MKKNIFFKNDFIYGENLETNEIKKISGKKLLNKIMENEMIKKKTDEVRRFEKKKEMKKGDLPFFILSKVNTMKPTRKIKSLIGNNNFKSTRFLILNANNIGNSTEVVSDLLDGIFEKDKDLLFGFISPSGTGIKLVYEFDAEVSSLPLLQKLILYYQKEKTKLHKIKFNNNPKNIINICYFSSDDCIEFRWNQNLLKSKTHNTTRESKLQYKKHFIPFWEYDEKKNSISIERSILLHDTLPALNIFRFKQGLESKIVKINNKIISEIQYDEIKAILKKRIEQTKLPQDKLTHKMIHEKLIRSSGAIFKDSTFEHLPLFKADVLRDEKDVAYKVYNNCFVEITSDNINTRSLPELPLFVFKEYVLDRDFTLLEEKSIFEKFLENVFENNDLRLKSIRTSIGYLLHKFKNPKYTRAIILMDKEVPLVDGTQIASGGGGKSLIGKALSYLLNMTIIDGKRSNLSNNFIFQSVNSSTDIVNFDDISGAFDFKMLFSLITSDFNTEKKFKDQEIIKFEDSPKILMTSNHVISEYGDSFNRRKIEVELSNFYNSEHTPEKDFSSIFFSEWDSQEWNKFDTFMLGCIREYIIEGKVLEITIDSARRIISITNEAFFCFMENYSVGEYVKKDLYEKYLYAIEEYEYKPSQRQFTIWLRYYALYKGWKVYERKSNSINYIKFSKKALEIHNDDI